MRCGCAAAVEPPAFLPAFPFECGRARLLPVHADAGGARAADLLDALPDYELVFEGVGDDGWAAYYRCDVTRDLNARFGDMQYKIQDLEVGGPVGAGKANAWKWTTKCWLLVMCDSGWVPWMRRTLAAKSCEARVGDRKGVLHFLCVPTKCCALPLPWLLLLRRRQATLCTELALRLLQHAPQLQRAAAVLAELDCLLAFALLAKHHDYCRPVLTEEPELHIVQGGAGLGAQHGGRPWHTNALQSYKQANGDAMYGLAGPMRVVPLHAELYVPRS